jgi:hypothetical protein
MKAILVTGRGDPYGSETSGFCVDRPRIVGIYMEPQFKLITFLINITYILVF